MSFPNTRILKVSSVWLEMQSIVSSVTLSPLRRLTVKICRMVGKCRIIGKCTVEKSLRGEICRMSQHVVMLLSVAAIIILMHLYASVLRAHLKMHRGEKFQRWDMMAQHIVMMSCCNPPVLIQSSKYTRWYVPWGNVFLLTRFKVEKNAILDGCSTVSVKWDGIGCLWLEWGMEHPIFSADYCCYAKKKGFNRLKLFGDQRQMQYCFYLFFTLVYIGEDL